MSSGSGSLARYILVRLLLVIPMMWVLLTVVFFLLRVARETPSAPRSAAVSARRRSTSVASARHRPAAHRPVLRVPRQRRPRGLRDHPLRQPSGPRRRPRPGRRHAHADDRCLPVRAAAGPSAGTPGRSLPRQRRRRGDPGLRRRHLRRPDLLGRHHVRALRGQVLPRLADLRHRVARSPSSRSRPRPTSCSSTRPSPATARLYLTCSSTTCCPASPWGCCSRA